jgi:hypothetical protein
VSSEDSQSSVGSDELRQNMDVSVRSLAALMLKVFTRTSVRNEGQFHLGMVSDDGIAVLTRTNSVVAKRIRVKSYSDLQSASTGKRIKLANNQSANITVTYNAHIYGSPTIKITWIQGLRRFETELKAHNIGVW